MYNTDDILSSISDMMFILFTTCEYDVVKSGKIPGELKILKAFNAPD
jgi:hypothetical protein